MHEQGRRPRTCSTLLLIGALACEGPRGPEGPQGLAGPAGIDGEKGATGTDGVNGTSGVSCWDLDANGLPDDAEDINRDGLVDALDCRGAPSEGGTTLPLPAVLDRHEQLPGVVITILDISGGSGVGGAFRIGDTIRVTFGLSTNAGRMFAPSDLDSSTILVSGPTENYQRVITPIDNWHVAATPNADGSYTYVVASPIPARFAPPVNDSSSFDADDGELAGLELVDGTYTIGMTAYKRYTIEGEDVLDPGVAIRDFILGTVTEIAPREVVKVENCNQCHSRLQFHDGTQRDTKLCVLCHTSGAEDKNEPAVEQGTPGVSVDFRVMIHRIHNGKHLPSVVGVTTSPDGTRNYSVTPRPYRIVGGPTNHVYDFSDVGFPAFPNLTTPMPRDFGYSTLAPEEKTKEDAIRRGVTACEACHGDSDGAGPLTAPAQGERAFTVLSKRACGSCHDDVTWSYPHTVNGTTMPVQNDDVVCAVCHVEAGTALAIRDGHIHPLKNPSLNAGLNVTVTSIVPQAGPTLDPGERLAVSFTITNDAGTPIDPSTLSSISVVLNGPTSNRNMVLSGSIPAVALGPTAPTYTINLPEPIILEPAGVSSAASFDVFITDRAPLWNAAAATTVFLVTPALGGAETALVRSTAPMQNWMEVADATGLTRNEYIVLDSGLSSEEYLRIQHVDGNRLWFGSTYAAAYGWLRKSHAAGATVTEVTATVVPAATYSLDAASGAITEAAEIGQGTVLVSYTSDFMMPGLYPPSLNDSPDLGEETGEWAGKRIVDGTYTVGMWASSTWNYDLVGETNTYRVTSAAGTRDLLVGFADEITPWQLISSTGACNACHKDLSFHGGSRRGFESCQMCHTTAGAEDRPRYVAPGSPATVNVSITFRSMLHKIHRGADLQEPENFMVSGYGARAYPNNFTAYTFEEIRFPAWPGGVRECAKCHGTAMPWKNMSAREHPTEQVAAAREWTVACGSCHDGEPAQAHIGLMTHEGIESCAVCHGPGRDLEVELVHRTR